MALFSTHGALYGNIPEGRWAKPQLQPPKRSQFMAFSLSHLFLLQPLSRAASSLSLLNRGLVKQKKYRIVMYGSAFAYPPPPSGCGAGQRRRGRAHTGRRGPVRRVVRGRQRGLRRWGRTSASAGATPCSSSAVHSRAPPSWHTPCACP